MASIETLAPPWLEFIPADDWGVIWKRPPVWESLGDSETYIHHGGGGRISTDPRTAMRTIQKWFHDVKNYSTIGYDVMVHFNPAAGTAAVCGAREGWLSAATAHRNDIGEAICLFGDFHPGSRNMQPHPKELEALAFAVAWSVEKGWSAPNTRVLGHRDNPAVPNGTACPGDNLYPHVPNIGRRAFEIIAQANQETPDMNILPKPRRVYDSRIADHAFSPGEQRPVTVGPGVTAATVNITVVGEGGTSGFVSVNDKDMATSAVNYDGRDSVSANAVPVNCENGVITIGNAVGTCHVIVDLMAQR